MINYETNTSVFFEANKNYCQAIENKFKTINIECSGYCNAYGYEVETTLVKNQLNYYLKLQKHQTTQNGVIIPKDATDYTSSELIVTGLNKSITTVFKKSKFKRRFSSKIMKTKLPSPYFMKSNRIEENDFVDNLIKNIAENNISSFTINKGKFFCEIHSETIDPLNLIEDIEKMLKIWE